MAITNRLFSICRSFALSAGIAATGIAASAAADSHIKVFMNHARILKLDRPVNKVIIGNSEVADITVADPQTIVLTGKTFGTTNLVILDKDGEPMVDEEVLVSINEDNTVRVFRQTDRAVLSCTPACEVHSSAGTGAGAP